MEGTKYMSDIRNQKAPMEYRRFGKTEKYLSVITLGGMRFKHGWEEPRDNIPAETLEQCRKVVQLAMNSGINHIESAWGYKKSETVYGKVLNEELNIPRNSYHLMTKGSPMTGQETRKMVEAQLKALQTDYLDFYGWHGLNNDELFKKACATKGSVEELLKMKEEGIIRHVGFSTHAPLETIIKAIESDLFDFVNLHYYYFNQRNAEAVVRAEKQDMGVFIISPNDKGGQLFNAPQKVRNATAPLTPINWNTRFCLKTPAVHTLSFGITEASHFEEMIGSFPIQWTEMEKRIQSKLEDFLNDDPYSYYDGFDLQDDESGINIPEILRLRKLWKCYDMREYGRYRYKIFGKDNHWLPGNFAEKEYIDKIDLSKVPENIPLKKMLAEAHREFHIPKYKMQLGKVKRKILKD